MKKLLLFFTVALLFISCKPNKGDGKISCVWWIGNTTDQTLILKFPYSESFPKNDLKYSELELKPNTNLKIFDSRRIIVNGPSLEYYFEVSAEKFGEEVNWQILSKDGVVLKTWNYSQREIPGQRLFEESSWDYHYNWEWWVSESWSFRIEPEDITTE